MKAEPIYFVSLAFLFALYGCDHPEITQERIDFKQREFEDCMALVSFADAKAVRACESHASTRDWQQDVVNRNNQ